MENFTIANINDTIIWDENIWGPRFWFFINTMAMTYPVNPHETTKKKYYEFIQNMPIFLPNPEYGNNFAKLLDKYPVTPYLDSRHSILKWVHFIHNKINKELKKDEITFDEFITSYCHIYTNDREKDNKTYKWKNKVIYFCSILALMVSVYIGYNIGGKGI
jgi:hypothetical protein